MKILGLPHVEAGFVLFTGKQAKPMEGSFSISFQKENGWSQTKSKDTLQFYGEHEKKKINKIESLFFAGVVWSSKKDSCVPIEKKKQKKTKQSKAKFSF